MSARYLKTLEFSCDYSLFPTDENGRPLKEYWEITSRLGGAERAVFEAMSLWLSNELRAAKRQFFDPPITWSVIKPSHDPKPVPYTFGTGRDRILITDVDFDIMKLLDLPKDHEAIGRMILGLLNEALEKLQKVEEFPCDIIRQAGEKFKEAGYGFPFKVGRKTIPGTRIVGDVTAFITPLSTARYLKLSYRKKPLYQMRISEREGAHAMAARVFSGFEREGEQLKVGVGPVLMELEPGKPIYSNGAIPEVINLNDHPEALEILEAYPTKS